MRNASSASGTSYARRLKWQNSVAFERKTSGPIFPAKVVELLARPQLTDLPENPLGTDS